MRNGKVRVKKRGDSKGKKGFPKEKLFSNPDDWMRGRGKKIEAGRRGQKRGGEFDRGGAETAGGKTVGKRGLRNGV